MTLQRMLRRRYGPGPLGRAIRAARFVAAPDRRPGLKASMLLKRPSDGFAAGHFCYGIHKLLPTPYTYITMLRRPVERLVSLYHYSRHEPSAFYRAQATRLSLEQFLLECRMPELDNGQLRFIVGGSDDLFINRTAFGQCGRDMLERAKQHLDNEFSVVGLVERFDESVLLMARQLGWSNAYYLKVNEGRTPAAAASLPPALYEEVARRNHLDILLYEYARQRLEQQIQLLGTAFPEQLRRFKALNRLFNRTLLPLYEPYARTKAGLKQAAVAAHRLRRFRRPPAIRSAP